MVWAGKSTTSSVAGSASIAANISAKNSGETWTGSTPMFKQLFLKISAKKLDTTQRNP